MPQQFDEAWPELANRLRATLIVRGVPAQDRDDVVQETALRVYRAWDGLDPDRPVWPFVVTVGLNYWRDVIRERRGRATDAHPPASFELTDDEDVERVVLARQELASVGQAMQAMAPEQRRLLFATEEFSDVVRPLLPAERVARMRARRRLARAVGRASAAVALVWLRRPGRTAGMVATAYVTAMATAVLTVPLAPAFIAPHGQPARAERRPAAVAAPHVTGPAGRRSVRPVAFVAAPRVSRPEAVSASRTAAARRQPHHASRTTLCSPTRPPENGLVEDVHVGSAGIYQDDGNGHKRPVVSTPPVDAQGDRGCVAVG